MIVQSWTAAPGLTPAQVAAKQQTQPGLTVAVAASTKAAPEVRKETYVFAAPPASQAAVLAMDDASNANDREAEAARAVAEVADEEDVVPSLLPPPRRDADDPAANFIPEPKPLVGPPPARLPLLGFDMGGNAALEEAQRLAQATSAYRGQRIDAAPAEGGMEPAPSIPEPDQTVADDFSRSV